MDPTGNGGDRKGNPDGSLEAIAVVTPSKVAVLVVLNRNDHNLTFHLVDGVTARQSPTLMAQAHSIQTFWYEV